jgi:KaiC/GvpD/RAD55 family RecA-like ATPase
VNLVHNLPESAPHVEHAMELASQGFYVFPLQQREKIPFKGTRGFLDASSTPKIVEKEFARYGADPNIGIATGQSGLVVIDIDPRHGGDDSWDTLRRGFAKFDTVEQQTGGGGRQLFFRADHSQQLTSGANVFGDKFPGIDLRATGGYVVAPPSIHPDGPRYIWDIGVDNIVPIPRDILDDLFAKQADQRVAPKQALLGKVPEGKRNVELTRIAGQARRHGWNAEMIHAALVVINQQACLPPLQDRELWQIANSIVRKAPEEELFSAASQLRMVIKAAADLRSVRQEWFADGRIPRAELTLFEGRGGLGKSTVALDFIARASAQRVLPGGGRLDRPYRSLLVAEEDSGGLIRARLHAAGADLSMVYIVEGMAAGDEDDLQPFRLPRDLPMLKSIVREHQFDLVYIDALFNSFEQKYSVNSSQDVRVVIGGLASVGRDTGATVIGTRHVGKADRHAKDRGLGSVDIGNVARSVIQFDDLEEGSPVRVMRVVKSNYGKPEDRQDLMYEFESVTAYDDNGKPDEVARVKWAGLVESNPEQQDALAWAREKLLEVQDAGAVL